MKTTTFRLLMVLTTLTCVLITTAAQTNDELKAKIEKINKEMAQAMVEGNTQKNLGLYTADAISLPNQAKMLEGIAAIKKSAEDMTSMGIKINSFEATTLHVKPYGNMIVEIGKFKINLSIPGMPENIEEVGKYLTIWEKQADGSLKIKVETWNSDTNPMEQQ